MMEVASVRQKDLFPVKLWLNMRIIAVYTLLFVIVLPLNPLAVF